MQNKSFLYRVIPRRIKPEQKLVQPVQKPKILRDGVRTANFFENCYIFSQPTFSLKPQTKKQKDRLRNVPSKTLKESPPTLTASANSMAANKSDFQVTQVLQNFSSQLETIHSRRKTRSFSASYNCKQKVEVETSRKRLEINAFNCEKNAKKVSFSSRSIHSCKTQRKKPDSRVDKVLQIYPEEFALSHSLVLPRSQALRKTQVGKQMRNRLYRPWSPEKLMSTTIQASQDLLVFLGTPL